MSALHRILVLLRLPLLAVVILLLPRIAGDLVADLLLRLPYPHGTVKYLLESWQAVLYRQRELLPVVLGCALAVAGLQQLRGRAWLLAAGPTALAGLLFLPWQWLPGVLALVALLVAATLPPEHLPRRLHPLSWLPGTELLAPGLVASALSLGRVGRLLLTTGAAAVLALGWIGADCLASYQHFRPLMEVWPDRLVDPRVQVLDRVPAGRRAEWHGVDILGDQAIVLAEVTTRILAYDLRTGQAVAHDLPARWGPTRAAPLDSESDPETGRTWVLEAADSLRQLRWTGQAWLDEGAHRYPFRLDYVYLRLDAERRRLFLTTVQGQDAGPRYIATVDLGPQGAGSGRARPLQAEAGPAPMPREVAWIPPLQRMVLAPDFGHRLYLADPATGQATPWLEVPTLDGKMRWVPQLQRLFLAIPNRPELWVIDPVGGQVERRFPTQPGVRAVAVDPERGLVVTASVITGRVLVQRLDDASVVDRFGTVMPMVRDLKLAPELGTAVLSTWSVLYAIPYATERALPERPADAAPPR